MLLHHLRPGSGQDLRQAEGGELLWAEGGGEAGDPHQGGGGGGGQGHRQGGQDGRWRPVLVHKTPEREDFGFKYDWMDLD